MDINNNLLNLVTYKSRKLVPVGNTTEIQTEHPSDNSPLSFIDTKTEPVQLGINSLRSMRYSDIKAAIYNKSHPTVNGVTTSYGASFDEICATLGISSGSSITKSALTKLTRNDSSEDANNDFFGALNRAFSYLGPNDTISYNDLMLFFMRGAGSDGELNFSEYKSVVNQYADVVQQQFEACTSAQEKLEFTLQKTRDYLEESQMNLQLDALERLTTEPCASENVTDAGSRYPFYKDAVNQVAHVGQIAFADLGDWKTVDENGIPDPNGKYRTITQGSYQSWIGDTSNAWSIDIRTWAGDKDGTYTFNGENYWGDGGITLNSKYYLENSSIHWYELVEVFVHELTHATAYYYYDVDANGVSFSRRGLDFLVNKGFLDGYDEGHLTAEAHEPSLMYMTNTMWDEWAAYTTSCNYLDSIAGDVFDSSVDLAVNGSQEKTAIQNHLNNTGYDARPNPDNVNWNWDDFNNVFYFDLTA